MNNSCLSTLYLPVLFGVEAAARDELFALGYKREQVALADGLVTLTLSSPAEAIEATATLNVRHRTAERILFGLTTFEAKDFDALYDAVLAFPFETWIEAGQEIVVSGYSRKSILFGVPSIQRTIKKAVITRLLSVYPEHGDSWPEKGGRGSFGLRFSIVSDQVILSIDTTGDGLHKRGYRPLRHAAPLRETLAAAILYYSHFLPNRKHGEVLADLMCGSGTFLIEAAMMAANIAPGRKRRFAAEFNKGFGVPIFDRAKSLADLKRTEATPGQIVGFDIDKEALRDAKANAERAGVSDLIRFGHGDVRKLSADKVRKAVHAERILFVINPPYGERLLSQSDAAELVRTLGRALSDNNKAIQGFRISVLSPDETFEADFGRKADKRRKLYNGSIRCQLFQYFRPSR